jgi:hypothetical protein
MNKSHFSTAIGYFSTVMGQKSIVSECILHIERKRKAIQLQATSAKAGQALQAASKYKYRRRQEAKR